MPKLIMLRVSSWTGDRFACLLAGIACTCQFLNMADHQIKASKVFLRRNPFCNDMIVDRITKLAWQAEELSSWYGKSIVCLTADWQRRARWPRPVDAHVSIPTRHRTVASLTLMLPCHPVFADAVLDAFAQNAYVAW